MPVIDVEWTDDQVVVDGEVVARLGERPDAWPSRRWSYLVRRPGSSDWEAGGRVPEREDAVVEAEIALGELGARLR